MNYILWFDDGRGSGKHVINMSFVVCLIGLIRTFVRTLNDICYLTRSYIDFLCRQFCLRQITETVL